MYRGGTGGGCPYQPISYSYKVTAVDLTNKESCKSERDSIFGYFDPCIALDEGPDNLVIEPENSLEFDYELSQNYPNPFNPITKIEYSIIEPSFVTIKIYDISGREVSILVSELKKLGKHFVNFDGSNLSSGIYYYKMIAGDFITIRKMLLIK